MLLAQGLEQLRSTLALDDENSGVTTRAFTCVRTSLQASEPPMTCNTRHITLHTTRAEHAHHIHTNRAAMAT